MPSRPGPRSERFLSSLAHDLRNPLGAVLAYADLLGKNPELSARAQTQLQNLRRSAERLDSFMQDIAEVASIQRGTFQLDLRSFRGSELLAESFPALRTAASKNKLTLTLEGLGPQTMIEGDQARLERALQILMEDRVRQSAPGGVVSLVAQAGAKTVSFTISGQGERLTANELARLFPASPERFGSTRELRLYLASKVAESHGGKLVAKSTTGSTTKYILTLPLSKF